MHTFVEAARFARPYLARYWFRFVVGIILTFACGLSNGLLLGGTYTMLHRMEEPNKVEQMTAEGRAAEAAMAQREPLAAFASGALIGGKDAVDAQKHAAESGFMQAVNAEKKAIIEQFYVWIDPWLPIRGRTLDWKQCLGAALLLPVLAAMRGFLGYGGSYLLAWSGQRITNDVKVDAFRKVSSLSLDYFNKTTTGELIARIENDAIGLKNFLMLGLSDLIKEPVTITSMFVGMLLIDWKLTLVSLIFLPLCIIPTRKISKKLKQLGRMDFSTFVGQSNVTMESFQNVRITKAYGLEEAHADAFAEAGRRSIRFNMKSTQSREMLNPIIQTLCTMGISALFLYVVWTDTKFETLSTFFVALMLFYTPFKKLNGIGVYITQLSLSLERLMGLFHLEPTVKEDPNPLPLTQVRDGIRFEQVTFSYGDGPVLRGISFTLPHGRRLGLAGESGSGKSSLLNLLFRFYDVTGGIIKIDGVPIERYRIADLRSQLALVSQDILLFNATVGENIGYGKIGATRLEIEEAARRAHAADFIRELPKGYDTPLGERGIRLSGGQRQRIAIARAFVRNAPILVLDEATASLDSKSEAEVQGAIDELTENRTVICVAHRLSTLRAMDEILVMDKGVVVEHGRFEDLLRRRGLFAAMAARQSIMPQAA